jgi:hypothetical protein
VYQFQVLRDSMRPAFAGLALTVAIAACGGTSAVAAPAGVSSESGGAASAVPTKSNANETVLTREGGLCKYVPIDLAERALGAQVVSAEAKKSSLGLGSSCRITVDENTALTLSRSEPETREDFEKAFDAVGLTDEVVEGLGEKAYRAAGTALGGPGARMTIYTGTRHISLTLYAAGDQAAMFEASEAVARALLEAGL